MDQPAHVHNPNVMRRARDLYAVYCASSEGKNFQGNPCPAWEALPPAIRGHWYTVASRGIELSVRDVDSGALTPDGKIGYLANEHEHPPTEYTLGHLPSMTTALEVWGRYSGIEPSADSSDERTEPGIIRPGRTPAKV